MAAIRDFLKSVCRIFHNAITQFGCNSVVINIVHNNISIILLLTVQFACKQIS